MGTPDPRPRVVVDVGLVAGLPFKEVDARIGLGLRHRDIGQRIVAFYLADLAERRGAARLGHASITDYAEQALGLDRRRAMEYVRVGRKLEDLPLIDEAFCKQAISWTKLLLLMRVVTPEHEEAWLEKARTLACKDLAREVVLARPGRAPREPGDRKGTPNVTFDVRARLDTTTNRLFEQAKKKLAAERGHSVGDREAIAAFSEMLIQTRADGTIPGRKPVDDSAYRVVFHVKDGDVLVDSPYGKIPVVLAPEAFAKGEKITIVDGAKVQAEYEEAKRRAAEDFEKGILPPKTPKKTRENVLDRDGHECTDGCGEHENLHVHHIKPRSEGGPSVEKNLTTKAPFCHARQHAGFTKIHGDADDPIYTDDTDRPLLRIDEYERSHFVLTLPGPSERPAPKVEDPAPPPAPVAPEEAFEGLVGLDDVLGRLVTTLRGSRALGRPFPHTLLLGPPGAGKTTVAKGLAAVLGARLRRRAGPVLESIPVLLETVLQLEEGDVLFIDEIHAVPRPVLEVLYEAMEEGQLSLGGEPHELPAFTLLAATTEEGGIPDALRDRFGVREDLGFRTDEEMAELLSKVAKDRDLPLTAEGAVHLAPVCRGTPRRGLRLLDRVFEQVMARERKFADAEAVEEALGAMGFDENGLDETERRYLDVLRESARPLSLRAIAGLMRTSLATVTNIIEPPLLRLGFVAITPRGRVVTLPPDGGGGRVRLAEAG